VTKKWQDKSICHYGCLLRITAFGSELKVTAFGNELKVANPEGHIVQADLQSA